MHQLIFNAFPDHFQANSIYAMQPFYTPAANKKMLTKQKKADEFTFDAPVKSPAKIFVGSHAVIKKVLADKKNFKVPWGPKMSALATFMLANDSDESAVQRDLVEKMMYGPEGAAKNFALYTEQITAELLKRDGEQLGKKDLHYIDVVRRFVNLQSYLRICADNVSVPALLTTQRSTSLPIYATSRS